MSGDPISEGYEVLRIPNNENELSHFNSGPMFHIRRDQQDPLPHIPDVLDEDPYMRMDSIVTETYANELPPSGPQGGYPQPQGGYREFPIQYRDRPYPEYQRSYNNDPYDPRGRNPTYRDTYKMESQGSRYTEPRNTSSSNVYISQPNMPTYQQERRNTNYPHPNYGYNAPENLSGRNLPQPIRPDSSPIYRDTPSNAYQTQVPSNQYPDMHSPEQLGAPDPNRNLPAGFQYTSASVTLEYSVQDQYRGPHVRNSKDMSNYPPADLPLPHRGEHRRTVYSDRSPEGSPYYDSQANRDYPRYPHDPRAPANLPAPRHPIYQQQRAPYLPQSNADMPPPRFNRSPASSLREENPYHAPVYQQVRPQPHTGYNSPYYRPDVPPNRSWGGQYEQNERYMGGTQQMPQPILAPPHLSRGIPSRRATDPYPEEPNPANFPKPKLFPERQSCLIDQVTDDFEHIQLAPAPHPTNPPPPPPRPRPRTPEPPGWKCLICTYHNKPTRPGCEMCTAPRPDEYVLPAGYEPDEEELTKQRLSEQQEVMEQERRFLEREKNYQQLMQASDQDLIEVDEEFECSICIVDVDVGDGVRLRECLHAFCRDCLSQHIIHAEDAEVKCPFQGETYQCDSVVTEREIKQLLSPEAYKHWQQMGLNQAEGTIQNAYHCKTADCPGWCVYEDDINFFNCPVCNVQNCLTCKAIHQGKNCKEYQEEIKNKAQNDDDAKRTQKMLEDMINQGEAMKCPKCHVIIQKKLGCDWIRCTVCKTEICWATKGLRWGPKGKGDTTGGCKCRADGRTPCSPQCKNCH